MNLALDDRGTEVIGSMLARGWSYSRIAKRHGLSSSFVRNWCLKRGLKSKHKPIVRRRKKTA